MRAISNGLGAAAGTLISDAGHEFVAKVSIAAMLCILDSSFIQLIISTQSTFTSRILLIICLYLAKLSVVVFSRKIFSGDLNHERLLFSMASVAIILAGLGSVLAASIGCHSRQYLLSEERLVCPATVSQDCTFMQPLTLIFSGRQIGRRLYSRWSDRSIIGDDPASTPFKVANGKE
jgi:hypothetical protein